MLSLRILIKFFITIIIYTIAIILLFIISYNFFRMFIWHGDELLYPILHAISSHSELFILFVLGSGYLVIFIFYWLKTLSYLANIIDATANMYDTKEEDLINLPADLKEVENLMNQIKLNIQLNQRAAKEAEQRKNDLIVYLAHDLKTPLTSVIGYLTLLRDEKQISDELREKYLSISLAKAERLEDLINEFFEITRFNLSNQILELSRINLTRMLEQITFEFQPMFAEKNLSCILDAPPDVEIQFDVGKMQRVFDNLIRNSINYSFPGTQVLIRLLCDGDFIQIDFINHGNTIPPEKLNRIFEQFFRLDTARTSRTGGAGLGLAIAKEIVELHKGTISAYSENEVIKFTVRLPAFVRKI